MAKNVTAKKREGFANSCAAIISGVISICILLLVTVFPLIYDRAYFNILETKYKCYYMSVLGMMIVLLVLSIAMLVIDVIEYKGFHTKALFAKLHPNNWKTTFRVPDIAVIAFLLIAAISTVQSDYVFESFWGNEGRFSGLFLLTLYVAAYFIISRCWKIKGWYVELFLISGLIMCAIGITDYFQMDILDFRGNIKPEQSTIFTSTVGNINTYTAYVGLVMGVSGAMFVTSKKQEKTIWYGLCLVISFFAIIMGCSDNAYLALGALFACLPLFLFKSRKGLWNYLVMVTMFATVVQCIDMINQRYSDIVVGLDSLFQILVNFGGLLYLVIALWALTIGVFYYNRKKEGLPDTLGILPVRFWAGMLAVVALAVCFALYDANIAGNAARYGVLGKYLIFDDSWGTNRGYIWRKSFELYRDFPTMHKIFGYGPDTFGILTNNEIKIEMVNATKQVFDSAHNEYLQYFVTIGPFGLLAYIWFLISAGILMIKNRQQNPYVIGCCIAVLCYGVQAFVNLSLPIATPIMWLLLSMGVAATRKMPSTES